MEKVCPVVLRDTSAGCALLVFRHPLAGVQLVKGTLETGETLEAAALRELREEAGLDGTVLDWPQWSSMEISDRQIWHFLPVAVSPLPDRFQFHTADDGGHVFRFFWWPFRDEPNDEWHDIFVRAFHQIRVRLG